MEALSSRKLAWIAYDKTPVTLHAAVGGAYAYV